MKMVRIKTDIAGDNDELALIIKNIEINRAINDAYNTYKHEGFYPIIVINIETDPTLVDVNIHPTKQDIKMSKISMLYELITKTIKEEDINSAYLKFFEHSRDSGNEVAARLYRGSIVEEFIKSSINS
jgi:hypothetical protein